MMFATDLVQGEGTDARTTSLLARCRVLVVPVVNADGFAHSRGFPIDDRELEVATAIVGAGSYWRKNRRALTGDLGLGQLGSLTAYGVDPNRNYGIQWGGPGAGDVPVQQDYRGPEVFSEPESRNVNRMYLTRGVTAVLTNHTYSDLVLRPWGDTEADSPDEPLLRQLGDACAAINGYTSQKSIALYPTTGTSEDHAYAAVGALAYTFEHGLDAFHPPYAGFVPEAYAKNREPFMILAEAAADPAHHSVITGTTVTPAGTGVAADIVIRKTVTVPTAAGTVVDPDLPAALRRRRHLHRPRGPVDLADLGGRGGLRGGTPRRTGRSRSAAARWSTSVPRRLSNAELARHGTSVRRWTGIDGGSR